MFWAVEWLIYINIIFAAIISRYILAKLILFIWVKWVKQKYGCCKEWTDCEEIFFNADIMEMVLNYDLCEAFLFVNNMSESFTFFPV